MLDPVLQVTIIKCPWSCPQVLVQVQHMIFFDKSKLATPTYFNKLSMEEISECPEQNGLFKGHYLMKFCLNQVI